MVNLHGARVLVLGGTGFVGSWLCRELDAAGAYTFSANSELRLEFPQYIEQLIQKHRPGYVFHCAGYNGGIAKNLAEPAVIYYRNTVMGLNVLDACARNGVKKVVSLVASCAYPSELPYADQGALDYATYGICEEKDFLREMPHSSVACHGLAKRNLQIASSFYHKQFGLQAVCVCPTTLYGPGDSFDPQRTKVMGGMVRRFVEAARANKQEEVVWGTGQAMREFLYVKDAAKLIVESMRHYKDTDLPMNLGSGQELSIKDLAEMVAGLAGYQGRISWDASKPDGQLRKRLDTKRMEKILPAIEFTPLADGIARTIEYYRATHV